MGGGALAKGAKIRKFSCGRKGGQLIPSVWGKGNHHVSPKPSQTWVQHPHTKEQWGNVGAVCEDCWLAVS